MELLILAKLEMAKHRVQKGFHECMLKLAGDEEGVGTIELVLILVVLIALVSIFKTSISELLDDLMGAVTSNATAITD